MQLLMLVNNGHIVTCVCMRQHLHTWVFTSMLLTERCSRYGSHEHTHCVKAGVTIELIETSDKTTLEKQESPFVYLAHHELESVKIIFIITCIVVIL